jgi:Na+-transporting methylmalonyl-CoA/oxaloacetate decarboxylase gamma subunit
MNNNNFPSLADGLQNEVNVMQQINNQMAFPSRRVSFNLPTDSMSSSNLDNLNLQDDLEMRQSNNQTSIPEIEVSEVMIKSQPQPQQKREMVRRPVSPPVLNSPVPPPSTDVIPATASVQISSTESLMNKMKSLFTGGMYVSVYGIDIAKSSVYILILFILALVIYYLYSYWNSGVKNKKERKPEVTYKEQEKSESKKVDKKVDKNNKKKTSETNDE